MLGVELLSDSNSSEWNMYLNQNMVDHFCLRWETRAVIEKTFGHKPYYLAAYRDGKIAGVLPLFLVKSPLFGNSLISIPYFNSGGVISDDDTAFKSLVKRAEELKEELKVSYVELRGRYLDKRYTSSTGFPLPVRTHKVAMRLELPSDPEKLLGMFDKKLRAQIKRPQKSGVVATVSRGANAAVEDFYQVFSKNMKDLGTPVYSKSLFQEVFKNFPDTSSCIVCYLDSQPVAAGITIGFQDSVEIPWASSLREFNSLSANMLLYFTAIQDAIRNGYSVFDFGRSSLDSGTFKFKAQWGAKPKTLHWYYIAKGIDVPDVNPNSPKFTLMVKLWRMLPLFIANKLGPVLTKGLP